MNQYTGIGNLTKDPTFTVGNDNKYCNFTVAVNNRNDDSTFIEVDLSRSQVSGWLLQGIFVIVQYSFRETARPGPAWREPGRVSRAANRTSRSLAGHC